MGVKLDDLPPKMRKQAEFQLSASSRRKVPRKASKSERDSHQALANNRQAPLIGQRVYLVVLMYRCKGLVWDLDNASFKPILDGLVQSGVFKDDSIEQIQGLIKLPRKCNTQVEERVEFEFWDAEYFEPYINVARRNVNEAQPDPEENA